MGKMKETVMLLLLRRPIIYVETFCAFQKSRRGAWNRDRLATGKDLV
jgi:hypothetical protein